MRVSDLVDLLSPKVRVLSGGQGLERSVRWVYPTDLRDPTEYLEGGELVLTNGQWRTRRADSSPYVKRLADAGVAGIGYGLRKPDATTPSDLVEACDAAGMVLLEVSHDTAFVAISELVATGHADARQQRMVQRLRRDEAFLSSVAGGGGVDEILGILGRDQGLDLVLVDPVGQVLGGTVPRGIVLDAAALAVAALRPEPVGVVVGGSPATVFPVVVREALEAFLVCFRSIDALTADELAAISHELVFVGLELSHALATRELTERLVDEVLDLIGEGDARAQELAARLRSLGLDPSGPLTVVAISTEPDGPLELGRRAGRLAGQLLGSRGLAGVVAVDGPIAVVISAPVDDERELSRELLAATARGAPAATAGIGSHARSSRELRRSVAEARLAAAYAGQGAEPLGLATHADVGSFRVLLAAHDAEVRAAFVQAVLGPVLDQDRARGTALISTLHAFLKDAGHWQRVADGLHVHVNTLRYRIGRVEQLTGRKLSSFEEQVNMFLALEEATELGLLEDPPNS